MLQKRYSAPLAIPPLIKEHTLTMISLHGRGCIGERYSRELLSSAAYKLEFPY